MVAIAIEYDFEKAAGLVARGNELEAAAAKTKIPFEDLKEYTIEYADVWHRIIKNERAQMLGQAGAEALTILRNLIRNGEEKTQVAAATILMKFWMTTIRHDNGGNAFESLGGEYYHKQLLIEEAEEKLAAEEAAALAAKNAPEPMETAPKVAGTFHVPSRPFAVCDAELASESEASGNVPAVSREIGVGTAHGVCLLPPAEAEIVVEVPSVPEKPVRPDEIEIFPTLNPNRSGLLAYERRPLSHDRGGG